MDAVGEGSVFVVFSRGLLCSSTDCRLLARSERHLSFLFFCGWLVGFLGSLLSCLTLSSLGTTDRWTAIDHRAQHLYAGGAGILQDVLLLLRQAQGPSPRPAHPVPGRGEG